MTLQEKIEKLVVDEYGKLTERGGVVLKSLLRNNRFPEVEKYIKELSSVVDRYELPVIQKTFETPTQEILGVRKIFEASSQDIPTTPTNIPTTSTKQGTSEGQKRYFDAEFFKRPSLIVGKELMGAKICREDKEGIIIETGAYQGHVSHRVEGLEYGPGRLYIMALQGGNSTLVIGTEGEGIASVVTIRALEIKDKKVLGVSGIIPYLGLNKSNNKTLFSEANISLELCTDTPTLFISNEDSNKHGIKMPNNCLGYYRKA